MITPSFECEQTDDFVIVKIRVPHVKISAIEYTITDKVFHFYVKPYFLRLTFDNELAENGTDTCKYDIESGIMIVNLPKKNHGEHFADLNMMTKLLSGSNKQKEPKPKSLIEVIGDEPNAENEEFEYDWEQTVPKPLKTDSSLLELEEEQIHVQVNNHPTYGFDNSHQQFFTSLGSDYVAEVISLRDPDTTPNEQRTVIRTEKENEDFDPDHYVADFIVNQEIQKIIAFKARYEKEYKKKQKSVEYSIKWMDIEKQSLTNLPKKECMFSTTALTT
jgi:protein SHQ1